MIELSNDIRRRRSARWLAVVGIVLLGLITSATALAQPKVAAGHLKDGHAAAKRHDWTTALTEFEAAESAQDSLEALEGIADAKYNLGRDDEAYEAYEDLGKALDKFRLDRKRRAAIQARIDRRLADLDTKTAKVDVTVSGTGATVFFDDRPLGQAPVTTTLHVKPGAHRVRVEPEGGEKQEQPITVAAGTETPLQLAVGKVALPSALPSGSPYGAPTSGGGLADGGAPGPSAGGTAAADGGAPGPAAGPPGAQAPGSKAPAAAEAPRPQLVPLRTAQPPTIDGVLNDPVWRDAPRESAFLSVRSTPYGQPSAEPTTVMVAYDERYLYVAFQCGYSSQRPRDDAYTITEAGSVAESVTVAVDPLHDHANALVFIVTRAGSRADFEVTGNGRVLNSDWAGIWDSAATHTPDAWYAEMRIPWGAMRLPSHDEKFSVGINFHRREPTVGELAFWALPPAGTIGGTGAISATNYDATFFGSLEGLNEVHPNLRLYIQPYVSTAYDQEPGAFRSRLYDFAGTQGNFRTYAGAYARFYPPGPVRVEANFNPDFSAVPPDSTDANFNRFELVQPEVRPFFAEDNPRFFFGDDDFANDPTDPAAQLYYSRRIGLNTNPITGIATPSPIIYAAKTVVRADTTEVSGMNVGLSSPNPTVALEDNITVARLNQQIGEKGNRLGGIVLERTGAVSKYTAGGVDGAVSLYDRRLVIDGFFAGSSGQGEPGSSMGEARASWLSENFFMWFTYLDVGKAFDAQLGYLPLTGVRTTWVSAGYKTYLSSDLQKKFMLVGSYNDTKDRSDTLVYDHAIVLALLQLANGGSVSLAALPSVENVTQPFALFAGRLNIPAARYNEFAYDATFRTASRSKVTLALSYAGGDLFGGTQTNPSATVGLNLGHFSSTANYGFYWVHYDSQDFYAHQLTTVASYSYTPLARSSLILSGNSLVYRAVAQFITTYQFGLLSTISLVLVKSTGTNQVAPEQWLGASAPLSAFLSFAYGISPF